MFPSTLFGEAGLELKSLFGEGLSASPGALARSRVQGHSLMDPSLPLGTLSAGESCWARVPALADTDVYAEVQLVSQSSEIVTVLHAGNELALPPSEVLRAGPAGMTVSDLTNLPVLNEATMLENLRLRFGQNKIYTRTSSMLVCINPFRSLAELYSEAERRKAQTADLFDAKQEPHLYMVAEQAFRGLSSTMNSQSIVVSGESGAGKTESIKYCMNYIVWRATGSDSSSLSPAKPNEVLGASGSLAGIPARIMQSNPILEAFGCAKTTRNDNRCAMACDGVRGEGRASTRARYSTPLHPPASDHRWLQSARARAVHSLSSP